MEEIPNTVLVELNVSGDSVTVDGKPLNHAKSLAVVNHSPSGFSWGYSGSGPSQLALAILLQFLTREKALSLYQKFKVEFVSQWPFGQSGTHHVPLAEWVGRQFK